MSSHEVSQMKCFIDKIVLQRKSLPNFSFRKFHDCYLFGDMRKWKAILLTMISHSIMQISSKYYGREKDQKLETVDKNFPFVNFVTTQYRYRTILMFTIYLMQKRRYSIRQTRHTLNPTALVSHIRSN